MQDPFPDEIEEAFDRNADTPEEAEMRLAGRVMKEAETSIVDGSRMLAFEKQDKKCARCGGPITEESAVLRLITSDKGMEPTNVILVCPACGKAMEDPMKG